MGKAITSRAPLTEAEVYEYLTKKVEAEEKHWGKDYIYAEWARKARDEKMAQYRNGEVVLVYTQQYVDHYGNGCGDFEDELYSDGHVETCCYGYLD